AVEWLLDQKVPNGTVAEPVPWRRNLVISYKIPEGDPAYPYLMGRAYVYDSALAAISFAMTDRAREAEDVLLALSRQLRPDGSIWFGVNVHNEWPSEEGHAGATVRSGASAWAGYAATFYLRKKALGMPDFHRKDRVGRRILFFAEKVARHLLSLQVSDAGDPRYGLVTGGMGSYELKAGEDGTVASVYSDEELGWVSTEHNIDAYFLFRDLGILTGEETYTRAAGLIARGLITLWDDERRQLIQGIRADGRQDTVLPLDTSSWGSIMLRAAGYTEQTDATLTAGLERFQIGTSGHFQPYADDPERLDGTASPVSYGGPDASGNPMEIAWPEGSLGMAAAMIKAGRLDEAERIIRAAGECSIDGALRYASQEISGQFSTYPSSLAGNRRGKSPGSGGQGALLELSVIRYVIFSIV
ncbi:MAG: hypothetical protein SVR04_05240, partial [Spirochaetota bacterium]|nr:hypothetical protein [Spirochaetota bacterium]